MVVKIMRDTCPYELHHWLDLRTDYCGWPIFPGDDKTGQIMDLEYL